MGILVQVDFDKARANMVESQVRTNDVSDIDLINAISNTRREAFVAQEYVKFSYSEIDVKSPSGRMLLKPREFSKLAQALNVRKKDEVLIIAGSGGYSAAVLALLAKSVTIFDSSICAVEVGENILGDLATLSELGGRQFDAIFVDQGVEEIPQAWFAALRDGGRMGIFVSENGVSRAKLYVKSGDYLSYNALFDAQVPLLPQFMRAREFEF